MDWLKVGGEKRGGGKILGKRKEIRTKASAGEKILFKNTDNRAREGKALRDSEREGEKKGRGEDRGR